MATIIETAYRYHDTVNQARSANTARTYAHGMDHFLNVLKENKFDPETTDIKLINEDHVALFISNLKQLSPATERLYLTAVTGFYEFLAAESIIPVNLAKIRLLIRQRARRPGIRLPQFPKYDIETVLDYAMRLNHKPANDEQEKYRHYRDRAFLLTLADTGLRIHEVCGLRRGDIDWSTRQALVIGKGDYQAVIRFSKRSMKALKDYLKVRGQMDGATGKAMGSLPVFARHDKGAGNKIKPLSTTSGRAIVNERVREALGPEAVGTITPHSFRHYFVTRILNETGNLKLAQTFARHKNIAVTQRYAHLVDTELDDEYSEIFDQEY
ncbi:MAG: tyrosine-type recombinase/integrase [Anaerolineaceae bacterium]|nr:tyrosine-type recombinase/integrase [Anaerolineaceae bacterium]